MDDVTIYEEFVRSIANRTDITDVGVHAAGMAAQCRRRLADPKFEHKHAHYAAQLERFEAIGRVRARMTEKG